MGDEKNGEAQGTEVKKRIKRCVGCRRHLPECTINPCVRRMEKPNQKTCKACKRRIIECNKNPCEAKVSWRAKISKPKHCRHCHRVIKQCNADPCNYKLQFKAERCCKHCRRLVSHCLVDPCIYKSKRDKSLLVERQGGRYVGGTHLEPVHIQPNLHHTMSMIPIPMQQNLLLHPINLSDLRPLEDQGAN